MKKWLSNFISALFKRKKQAKEVKEEIPEEYVGVDLATEEDKVVAIKVKVDIVQGISKEQIKKLKRLVYIYENTKKIRVKKKLEKRIIKRKRYIEENMRRGIRIRICR